MVTRLAILASASTTVRCLQLEQAFIYTHTSLTPPLLLQCGLFEVLLANKSLRALGLSHNNITEALVISVRYPNPNPNLKP